MRQSINSKQVAEIIEDTLEELRTDVDSEKLSQEDKDYISEKAKDVHQLALKTKFNLQHRSLINILKVHLETIEGESPLKETPEIWMIKMENYLPQILEDIQTWKENFHQNKKWMI